MEGGLALKQASEIPYWGASKNSARDLELLLEHLSAVLGFIDPQTPWKNPCSLTPVLNVLSFKLLSRSSHPGVTLANPGSSCKPRYPRTSSRDWWDRAGDLGLGMYIASVYLRRYEQGLMCTTERRRDTSCKSSTPHCAIGTSVSTIMSV